MRPAHIAATTVALGKLAGRNGPATVLVNNAARDDRHGWESVMPDYFDERIATNLKHMFFVTQAVAPGMIASGEGSLAYNHSVSHQPP